MSADLWFRITLGGFLVAALCAVLWMMFHGRRFLPDNVREELRESQRRSEESMIVFYRSRKVLAVLALLFVLSMGLEMTRTQFWEASWPSRLGMVAVKAPLAALLAGVVTMRLLIWGTKRSRDPH